MSSYRAYAHNLLCSKYVNPLQKTLVKRWIKLKLSKIKNQCLVTLATFWVFHRLMWLVATILDSTDLEHYLKHRVSTLPNQSLIFSLNLCSFHVKIRSHKYTNSELTEYCSLLMQDFSVKYSSMSCFLEPLAHAAGESLPYNCHYLMGGTINSQGAKAWEYQY